jgi:hypothetical protein
VVDLQVCRLRNHLFRDPRWRDDRQAMHGLRQASEIRERGQSLKYFNARIDRVDLANLAQRAGLDDFGAASQRGTVAALVTHLGHHLAAAGQLAELAGLSHAVRQRLLAVDVLADLHERLAQRGVPMVGRGDQYGVEARGVFEQPAVVVECLGILGRLAARLQGVGPGLLDLRWIRIAQGYEVRAAGQQVTLQVSGNPRPFRENQRLSANWAQPQQAAISTNDESWSQTISMVRWTWSRWRHRNNRTTRGCWHGPRNGSATRCRSIPSTISRRTSRPRRNVAGSAGPGCATTPATVSSP